MGNYSAILRETVELQEHSWWEHRQLVDHGTPVAFHPIAIYLKQTPHIGLDYASRRMAVLPEVNAVVDDKGRWCLLAAGSSRCGPRGSRFTLDCIHQGHLPVELDLHETIEPAGHFFGVALTGVTTQIMIESLILGCRAIQHHHQWRGDRLIGESEWTTSRNPDVDLDDIRERILS